MAWAAGARPPTRVRQRRRTARAAGPLVRCRKARGTVRMGGAALPTQTADGLCESHGGISNAIDQKQTLEITFRTVKRRAEVGGWEFGAHAGEGGERRADDH
ncbi:hypothetical protein GCM10009665_58640 [Kitasatospora nipponensis]|uniref:DDE family transposase n=1 Tax=Kitasatospora nipponensis TaxID=258049 RepID=A0ABN1WUC0_9ACTN